MFAGEFDPSNPEISAGVKVAVGLVLQAVEPVLQGNQSETLLWREVKFSNHKLYALFPAGNIRAEIAQAAWQTLKKQFEENLGVDWNRPEKIEPHPRRNGHPTVEFYHKVQSTYRTNLPTIKVVEELWLSFDGATPEAETVFIRNLKPKSLRQKIRERLLVALRGQQTGNPRHFPRWE